MKQVIYGMTCGGIVIFFALILLTLYGRGTRKTETQQALAQAMENALEQVMTQESYAVGEKDLFVADFLCELLVAVDSDAAIDVNILKADNEKGLLDVEVVETFHHPNGEVGKIAVRRTVIFDQKLETQEVEGI